MASRGTGPSASSSLARQLQRAKQGVDPSTSILAAGASPTATPTTGTQSGVGLQASPHQHTDLSPSIWGEAPGAALERSLALSPAADRANSRVSPVRSPRSSPSRTAGSSRGSGEPPSPSLSQTLAARERTRLHHEVFEHPDDRRQSPKRTGVLGSKAQERGTGVASGGLGRLPERSQTFESFHRQFTNRVPGAFIDGDTSTLVEDAERQARAASSRSPATRGYQLPGSEVFVTPARPKTSRLHHSSRVTTGASFLDAGMPARSTFLVMQDERKLALAVKRDQVNHGHMPEAPTATTSNLRDEHSPKLFHRDGTEMRPSIQKLKLRGAVLTQQLEGVRKWDREQWLEKDEARIRAEMRAQREQRRAKDAEFDHLRLLRAGSCTDGSILRQLQRDKQQQSQQSFDLSSPIDGAAVESESGRFSSLSDWHSGSSDPLTSSSSMMSAPKLSPSPPRRSTSPAAKISPPGSTGREQSHSRSRVQLRPDTDRAADDLVRLDREDEREQSRRRLAGLIELIS